MRNGLYITCIFFLSLFASQANAALVDVDLTQGVWVISAIDDSGLTWDGSTIDFEVQTADGDNWLLEGYFEWIGSNGAFGRENFTGTLFADSSLELAGFEIVQPASGIVLGNYFATLDGSGNAIIDGSWDGSGIPSDDWSAVRVPLPGAIWLFASAVLAVSMRKLNTVID